jgi:transcriptional regulator with XRE-family HTH domain
MVEKPGVRHPEFGQRVRERAKARRVSISDIKQSLKVTYEMARRYYLGIAKPRGKRMQLLAATLDCQVAWLEYGSPQAFSVREQTDIYVMLDDDARDVATAWSLLPEPRKQLYKEAIFRDAAMKEIFSDLFAVSIKSSYFKFLSGIRESLEKTFRRRKVKP